MWRCGLWLSVMHWHLRASKRVASRPPTRSCCPSSSTEAAHTTQHLHPFLMIPGTKCLWQAMNHIIVAPIDVSLQPRQHCAPGPSARKFWSQAHKQGAIVNGPGQVFEMSGIFCVKESYSVRYTRLFRPVPPVGTPD